MRKSCLAFLVPTLVGALTACGGPAVVQAPPAPRAVEPAAPAEPDAFREFRGAHAKPGTPFRLQSKPMAVDGVELVVTIVKVDWSTMTGPSGKETREATANLRVQKGAEDRAVTLGQGDTRTILGARLTLQAAGEEYDKSRLSYEPWIDLLVERAVDTAP